MGEVVPASGDPLRKARALMCDFDGTITLKDTAEWILDEHAEGDWQALDEAYVRGEIDLLECMRRQFALVRTERSQLLRELDEAIVTRPGFTELVRAARSSGAKVVIVSAGLDFVIDHFLRRLGVHEEVERHSAITSTEDGHITFEFPPLRCRQSTSFKDDVVRWHKGQGFEVSYAGDGTPDAEACAISDVRFVVKGSKLESIMSKRALEAVPFEDFRSILPYFENGTQG